MIWNDAVHESHIVTCATTATSPVVHGAWLAPGTHLDLVGAFKPNMREVDDDAVARSIVYVDTFAGALAEAADIIEPIARGVIARSRYSRRAGRAGDRHCAGPKRSRRDHAFQIGRHCDRGSGSGADVG